MNRYNKIEIKRKIRELKEKHLELRDSPKDEYLRTKLENQIDILEWVLE